MPDGPVLGNGDMALILGGGPDRLSFDIGKSDFWGIERGAIAPVGTAFLETPQLKGATFHVEQNVGPATLTGNFKQADGHEMSFRGWIAQPENLLVMELSNTGSRSLSFGSTLLNPDPYGIPGNEGTYAAGVESTSLRVSPDSIRLELGNHLAGKNESPFHGKIAQFRVYDRALREPIPATSGGGDNPLLSWSAAQLDDTYCLVPAPGDAAPSPHWIPAGRMDPSLSGISFNPRDDHGGSVAFGGEGKEEISPGVLCFPQKGFTVDAWVQATAVGGINTILAAVVDEDPTRYPFYHGFNLSLVNGRLSTTLNDASVTAIDSFPLNKWVQVAAAYDVDSLTLYADGQVVGRTTEFPTAADQMGWNKRAIHLGDPAVPFSGCAPAGLMIQRVLGVQAQVQDQRLSWTLAPGARATLLVAAVTDRNFPNYGVVAQRLVEQDPDALKALFLRHEKWWQDFWSRSFVRLSDRSIQDSWYASLYLLACASRADLPAPGLWGNYATTLKMAWQGDYTLNYNYEAPFWAAYASNHLELADNYEQVLLDHIPRGLAIARFAQQDNDRWFSPSPFPQEPAAPPKYQGILFYMHLIPLPGWSDDYNTFIGQKSEALYCAVNIAQRWRYTRDPVYAKKVYPFLRDVADFWDHYLVFQNGRYMDFDDAAAENSGSNTNPATTLAFLRLLYPCLLDLSQTLNVDAARRDKWQDIFDRLSDYILLPASSVSELAKLPPSDIQGRTVIRDTEVGPAFPKPMIEEYRDRKERGSSAGMNSTQVIFPGWGVGMESPRDLRKAALDSVTLAAEWYDYNDDCTFYPSAAAAGYDPKEILLNLGGLLASAQFPNGMMSTGGGGTEDFSVVPATLGAMFLQSYQRNIHVFPNWPADEDASFGNLSACGGFLISSARAHGRVQYVKIQSNAGQECRLANPWPESAVQMVLIGNPVKIYSGPIITFPTTISENVLLRPQD